MLFGTVTTPDPHWLQRLGLLDGPAGTVLTDAELAPRGFLPLWLAVVLLILGAAGAAFFYARETTSLSWPRRGLMALLRTLLIALVLFLLLRPALVGHFIGERPRGIVVLIDGSQSMTQADRRVTARDAERVALAYGTATAPADPQRIDLVRAALSNPQLDLLTRLAAKGPVQVLQFDRRLSSPEPGDLTLRADGAQTALADAIAEVLARQGAEPPAAIVAVTDGRDNASKLTLDEAARACRDRGVALHIWGVGSSESGILQIKDVRVPPTVFVDAKKDADDDPVRVPVRFRARGYKKGTLVLTLKVGDRVKEERFAVTEGENLERVIEVVPAKGSEGERPVEVTLRLEGAKDIGDSVNRVVQVKNSRVKVLYVEGVPRREYLFIQPVLNRDRRVLPRVCLLEGDEDLADLPPDPESGLRYLKSFPENFPAADANDPDKRPYDLLILGDVPYRALGDRGAKAIATFVKEGGGLVMHAGRKHAPGELAGTALAEVLPVELRRMEFGPDALEKVTPFRPVLSYDGENSAMMALADAQKDNLRLWREELWKEVAGFEWYYPAIDLRPGATVLLAHPERKVGRAPSVRPMPIISSQYYGKGEVLFIATDETWRWRHTTGDRLTARFWGQVVARLGLPHLLGTSKRTQLEMERGEPVLGRPSTFKARLLDLQFNPITRETVAARLVSVDGPEKGKSREVTLRRVAGQPGEYRGSLPNDVAGRHELLVAAGDGVEAATMPYRVELPPRHELEPAGLDEDALLSAALAGGGSFYREEDLARLPEGVVPQQAAYALRQERPVGGWFVMGLFVLLITAEWLVRKFSNLS